MSEAAIVQEPKTVHFPRNIGGHLGRDKTLHKICSRFYWKPDMTGDIKKFIETCDVCQRVNDKFSKPSTELCPIPVESEIWQQVQSYYFYSYMLL